jgi:hypothetical protein
MKKEDSQWLQHEAFDLLKQASAVVIAIVTLGGFIATTWNYFGFWIPISTSKHEADLVTIRASLAGQYNYLKRLTLANRVESYQMRITNLSGEVHSIEDAIAVHQRALNNPQVTEQDKEISRRRIATLQDNLKWVIERQKVVYAHMDKIREAIAKLPYDPSLGDLEEIN